ncbi:MAG TPA: hypothetical protein DCZ88_16680, partial [Pseudanabaena sp.]|nr:hypothetical protein [Pseudanabaena sp.]
PTFVSQSARYLEQQGFTISSGSVESIIKLINFFGMCSFVQVCGYLLLPKLDIRLIQIPSFLSLPIFFLYHYIFQQV